MHRNARLPSVGKCMHVLIYSSNLFIRLPDLELRSKRMNPTEKLKSGALSRYLKEALHSRLTSRRNVARQVVGCRPDIFLRDGSNRISRHLKRMGRERRW